MKNKRKRSRRACPQQAELLDQAPRRREAVARFRTWKARWQRQATEAVRAVEQELEELLAF